MNAHPHGEKLSAYLDGMLDLAQMRVVAAHLSVCPQCRAAHEGLRQTKGLLRVMSAPVPPPPDFWTDSYRRLRVGDAAHRPAALRLPSWDALRGAMREPQRRWSAGLAAAALIAAGLAGPLTSHNASVAPVPPIVSPGITAAPTAPDSVDVSSLVQAHAESAARQPLADASRQDMIAMDDSFTVDDVAPDLAPGATDVVGDASP